MKSSNILWIALLVVIVALAVVSGFWAIETMFKIILYVILALLAIWAIMMLLRGIKGASNNTTHTGV